MSGRRLAPLLVQRPGPRRARFQPFGIWQARLWIVVSGPAPEPSILPCNRALGRRSLHPSPPAFHWRVVTPRVWLSTPEDENAAPYVARNSSCQWGIPWRAHPGQLLHTVPRSDLL